MNVSSLWTMYISERTFAKSTKLVRTAERPIFAREHGRRRPVSTRSFGSSRSLGSVSIYNLFYMIVFLYLYLHYSLSMITSIL